MELKLQILVNNMMSENQNKNLLIGNFLDQVKSEDLNQIFEIEPDFCSLNEVDIVYIVAMAHKLLNDQHLEVPEWIKKPQYCLEEPYFWLKTEGKMKLYLLYESPLEFKIRNLFVSNNVLERV